MITIKKAVMHGITRSAITKLQGGRWSSGFWSGFASSGFSVGTKGYGGIEGRTMIMAVVGGTVSEVSGSKFANGAVTGAFMHLFNAWGGFRKLGGKLLLGQRGSYSDKQNNMIAHEQFFFDDGNNIGYGDKGMIRTGENLVEYSQLKYYDDTLLRQAVKNIGNWNAKDYHLLNNNCQDYAESVTKEYNKLKSR